MNFLLPNKFNSRHKPRFPKTFLFVGILIFVIIGINHLTFGTISATLHSIGVPIWQSQAGIINVFENVFAGFKDKQNLQYENKRLREEITRLELASLGIEILRQENEDLRTFLNRETSGEFVLATILTRPNQTLYDTFIVDVGRRDGVTKGVRVFGIGNIAIGSIKEVYSRTSLISLYSTPGRSIEVLLGSELIVAEAIGRGGGDFEIRIPRGVEVLEGHAVFSPEINGGILGVIEEVIALPADSFKTILFSSPVNIQSLRIVTIELQ